MLLSLPRGRSWETYWSSSWETLTAPPSDWDEAMEHLKKCRIQKIKKTLGRSWETYWSSSWETLIIVDAPPSDWDGAMEHLKECHIQKIKKNFGEVVGDILEFLVGDTDSFGCSTL